MEAVAVIRLIQGQGISTVELEFDRGDREAGLALLTQLAPVLARLDCAVRESRPAKKRRENTHGPPDPLDA